MSKGRDDGELNKRRFTQGKRPAIHLPLASFFTQDQSSEAGVEGGVTDQEEPRESRVWKEARGTGVGESRGTSHPLGTLELHLYSS